MYSVLADLTGNEGYHHMWGDSAWGWVWGIVMMAAMVGLAVVLILWLVRASGSQNAPYAPPDPTFEARSILATRLANGELSADEYSERLSHLR